jgi:hypothetical protein
MEFLGRKINVETERWDDLKWGEHSHAFTVAHSVGADVLNEIHGLLDDALADGEAFGTFRDNLREVMRTKGWYGGNGRGGDEKDYIKWRTKVIFDTNMRTAYSAGRYRQALEVAETRPIWQYRSKLVGAKRRQDHVALHDKAFRYDDPFWDTNYPPNGWGCACSVVTLSEAGARRRGVDVLSSDAGGKPPNIGVDWDKFAKPEWRYNPGREALAPNFRKYERLKAVKMPDGKTALSYAVERYRRAMDGTRMTEGEFKTALKRMNERDYTPINVLYQAGNLDEGRFNAMARAGVSDSKIMTLDAGLYHGTADKNAKQKIPERLFDALYQTLQTPERIYENTKPDFPNLGREYHFVKDTKDGKILNVVLRSLTGMALRIITMGHIDDHHGKGIYKKIW